MFKQITIANLQPGMMITQVIEQHGPVKIKKVGMIRSPDMIKGLREMGVTLLEVDLSQSVHTEADESTQNESLYEQQSSEPSSNKAKPSSTATQRLVASDKQIADVDRHLSQQFHRSLFMPAVDQMPSKWVLYGKPYAKLAGIILGGLLIGYFSSTFSIHFFSETDTSNGQQVSQQNNATSENASSDNNLPSNNLLTEDTSAKIKQENDAPSTSVQNDSLSNNSNDGSPQNITTATAAELNQDSESTDGQNATSDSTVNTAKSTANDALAAQDKATLEQAQNTNANSSSNRSDGIVLEEGQQVLGYQANEPNSESDTTQNTQSAVTQTNSNQSANTNELADTVNNDLLRRVQQAAQEVESNAERPEPEVLRVTDLNDLPRIDQLPPGILTQMPAMSFSAHMYASNPQDRWVRVNSRRLGEGDYIDDDLLLKHIESEKVVLMFRGREFTMNALSDW